MNHWRILSNFFFTVLFLLGSIALTITNTFSASLVDFRVGQTNPGTFGVAVTSCCSRHSGSSMPLLCYIEFNVCRAIIFAVTWNIQLPIPAYPMLGVPNDFRCAILITFDCMTVVWPDSVNIQVLSLSSWEVLRGQSWWQRRCLW